MGEKHLLELIFVVVVLFPCDSIFLEKIYVFVHIFLIVEKPQKALVRCCSTQLGLSRTLSPISWLFYSRGGEKIHF